jgi:hypothetical protein
MAPQALFKLVLTDGTTQVDFIGATYKVIDGGFNIGTPEIERELHMTREGFYVPLFTRRKYREAEIVFNVVGADRSAITKSLGIIERLLGKAEGITKLGRSGRVEIAYAWKGSENVTYFKVYGGQLSLSDNIFSVENVVQDGMIRECRLRLFLSPVGYGFSHTSKSITYPISLGLRMDTGDIVATKNIYGGVVDPDKNQLEIVSDLTNFDSGQVAAIRIKAVGDFSKFQTVYLGLVSGLGTGKNLSFANIPTLSEAYTDGFSLVASAGYPNGSYVTKTFGATPWQNASDDPSVFIEDYGVGFDVGADSQAYSYYVILHAGATAFPTTMQVAHGFIYNFLAGDKDLNSIGRYVSLKSSGQRALPLYTVEVPPVTSEILDYAESTLTPITFRHGLWMAGNGSEVISLSDMSFIPNSSGFRVWVNRLYADFGQSARTGTVYDDGFRGTLTYYDSPTAKYLLNGVYGMLGQLRLCPSDTSILTVLPVSDNLVRDLTTTLQISVDAIPSFDTLAW